MIVGPKKLTFLTFSPFSSHPGHLGRLSSILSELSKLYTIDIICLSQKVDDDETKNKYNNVTFHHFPIKFNGWEIDNLHQTVNKLVKFIGKPDLVILQMEVWELMRELSKTFKGKVPFTTVIHGMPFIAFPVEPSGNFELDTRNYLKTDIEEYRRRYISKHYKEAAEVLSQMPLIACYKTISYYLNIYFNNLNVWDFITTARLFENVGHGNNIEKKYDFIYMSRMEAGKGVEYLDKILSKVSQILSRPVSIAILGRTDDPISSKSLSDLIKSSDNGNYKVDFMGWANEKLKKETFSNSSVFLYPSHYDSYAFVLLEALSYGLPVVAWDVPFTSLNYSNTKAVNRIPLFDFDSFANVAAKTLLDSKTLQPDALKFVDTLKNPHEVALSDSAIYEEIIKFANKKSKTSVEK